MIARNQTGTGSKARRPAASSSVNVAVGRLGLAGVAASLVAVVMCVAAPSIGARLADGAAYADQAAGSGADAALDAAPAGGALDAAPGAALDVAPEAALDAAPDAAALFLPAAMTRGEPGRGGEVAPPPATRPAPTLVPTGAPSGTSGAPSPTTFATALPTAAPPPTASAVAVPQFAPYVPVPVDVVPDAPDYTPDLARVTDAWLLQALSAQQQSALERNGFVVVPAANKQFYHVYTEGYAADIPAFVTTDALLHTYHKLYSTALRSAEEAALVDDAQALTAALLAHAAADPASRAATQGPVQDAARQTLAFFAVAAGLLAPGSATPAEVQDLVAAELELIAAHQGVARSPIFGYDEDYSQYVPRGHYTKSETLERYFRTMMWYGHMGFRLDPDLPADVRRRETRAALLIVDALHLAPIGAGTALDVWDRIYDVTAFFVGTADDLTVHDYAALARQVYGHLPEPGDLDDNARLDTFIAEARTLRPPAILNTPLGPGQDRVTATMGFRFMGQRYIPDSAIFQQLVYDEVPGLYRGQGAPFTKFDDVRSWPRGLDVPAALGSARALEILTADGDTDYGGYDEQLATVSAEFAALEPSRWTSNLYWSWLNSLSPLLDVPADGFPYFMRNPAWVDKSLNTWLGSWSQLRHDTILYAKPSMPAALGVPEDQDGYVEPDPWLFARLAALTAQMRTGLRARGLLAAELAGRLDQMEALLLALKEISERELVGQQLTDEQHEVIRGIGGPLRSLVQDRPKPTETAEQIAVVADVHTVPMAGQVLEEGVGDAFEIYVVLPRPRGGPGQQSVMRGAVFSYYEFKWPMSDRLTDERWQAMDPKPPVPAWTSSYLVAR